MGGAGLSQNPCRDRTDVQTDALGVWVAVPSRCVPVMASRSVMWFPASPFVFLEHLLAEFLVERVADRLQLFPHCG